MFDGTGFGPDRHLPCSIEFLVHMCTRGPANTVRNLPLPVSAGHRSPRLTSQRLLSSFWTGYNPKGYTPARWRTACPRSARSAVRRRWHPTTRVLCIAPSAARSPQPVRFHALPAASQWKPWPMRVRRVASRSPCLDKSCPATPTVAGRRSGSNRRGDRRPGSGLTKNRPHNGATMPWWPQIAVVSKPWNGRSRHSTIRTALPCGLGWRSQASSDWSSSGSP